MQLVVQHLCYVGDDIRCEATTRARFKEDSLSVVSDAFDDLTTFVLLRSHRSSG